MKNKKKKSPNPPRACVNETMQSTSEGNQIAGNHDGSVVDVTLIHSVAVFPPLLLLGLERRGRRISPISKYTKCLLLCFFNQTQDNEGGYFSRFFGREGREIKKQCLGFPLDVF